MRQKRYFSRVFISIGAICALILAGVGPSLAMSGKPATQEHDSKEHAGKEHAGKEHAGIKHEAPPVESRDLQIGEIEKKAESM
jgi:hypothetical protein